MAQEISSNFSYQSKYITVDDSKMHYIDEYGDAAHPDQLTFLFLHGNPTSNYLWRNIIPYVKDHGRAVAPDLIGMGKSDKPDISYTFLNHIRYLKGFILQLELKNIVLVIHDWGSALGFNYALLNEKNVKGIVFMEALTKPMRWKDASLMTKFIFKRFRDDKKGHRMIAEKNMFIKLFLFKVGVKRKLTEEEKAHYSSPYPTVESRKPIEVWPKEIPIDGFPEENHAIISRYTKWLQETDIPMLLTYAKPGMIIKKKDVIHIEQEIKHITTVYIGKGKHYIQEDQPHNIGRAISNWVTNEIK
jgi:haloalkane dehalogenase